MIDRHLLTELRKVLGNFPSVAILGARQTGKTTLAKQLNKDYKKRVIYLDLENPSDRAKLDDPYDFLNDQRNNLVILDEVQRIPELYAVLRSSIDANRKPGRFLLLGSVSPNLVKGISQSLAGRIYNAHLDPVNFLEVNDKITMKRHWFRGGFPEMLTVKSDELYKQKMDAFITTFIERDLQNLFGVNISNVIMRKFWQMLAHSNGGIWNAQDYSRSLGITAPTVNRYLDFLEGAFMVHRLPAYYFNARKRIIKAPKVYLRDTGIMHRFINLAKMDDLYGHPSIGASWEAYVVEQIFQLKNKGIDLFYYRTQAGAEADLVLIRSGKPLACIEIKLNNVPVISKGFYQTIKDLKTKHNFVVKPSGESYRKGKELIVTGLEEFLVKHIGKLK